METTTQGQGPTEPAAEPAGITFNPDALAEAERLSREEPAYAGLPLRLYIEGKGCDGFYYGVTFAAEEPGDILVLEHGGLRVVIDADSHQFMGGATVQWVDDERGRGFLVDNPEHRRFRGKFYKRKDWLAKFTAKADEKPLG